PHLVRDSGFILEQHGYAKDRSYKGFLEVSRGGSGRKLIAVSKAANERVPAKAIVIGFEPRITSYLSGRNIFSAAEVLKGLRQGQWPGAMKKSKVSWILYEKDKTQREFSVLVAKLLRTRAIAPVSGSETTIGTVVLTRVSISDGLARPKPTPHATTRPTTMPATRSAVSRKRAH